MAESARTLQNRVNELKRYQTDLMDDSGGIGNLNRRVDDLIGEWNDLVRCCACRQVESRLAALKEPSQSSDGNLTGAHNTIQQEINALNREIAAAQAVERAAQAGGGGGGGAW